GRTAFPNNRIPSNRISPQAQAILNYFPLPNIINADPLAPNYAASGGGSFNANKWDTREDYFMNEKTTFFGRYSNHQFERSAVGAFGNLAGGPAFNAVNFAGNSFVRNQSVSIGTTHTFNPNTINEFRFGYMKYTVNTTPNGVGQPLASQAGIPGLNLDPYYTSGLPYFNFQQSDNSTQLTSLGYSLGANQCNCPLTESEGQYQFTDNLTKISGNHTYKFGADIRYAKNLRVPSDSHRAGELTFNAARTGFIAANADGTSSLTAAGGLSFASFLLGDVTGFSRYVSTSTNAAEHQRRWFFYGQDSWRVTSKLTLTYGLRWELVFPEQVNGAGNGAQLDLRTGLINVFGVGNVSIHGVQDMNYLNFAPRLGLAYQLTSKTVIRAGYGWSYGLGTFGATFGHNVTQNPPVLFNQTPTSQDNVNFEQVFRLADGPPSSNNLFTVPPSGQFLLPNGINAKARPLDVRLPRTEAYNVTVEQQIAPNTSVSAAYVGNVGRHVSTGAGNGFNFNVNAPNFVPGISSTNLARPFFSRYGWTQGIDFYCMCLNNSYNSFQFQIKRNYASGYGIQGSYTYQVAKAIAGDDYSILYNRSLAYGDMDSLPNHQVTVSQNFDIPFGRSRKYGKNINPFVDAVLGGWTISGVTTFYSGLPFTPNLTGINNRPYTGPSGRPNVGSGSPYAANQSRAGWLNIGPNGTLSSAFVVPAVNTFGNYAINSLRGPIFINQDLNLAKKFRLTERFGLEVRGEAYNIFNHANLGIPNNNVNGSNAGIITGLAYGYQMRRLQFATRIDF
ncbi:MAG: TonB-dependent receptor, partial [Acidobacteriaceae bacterium]|nr:TonB-dependent receptor [Acidobacteriaceae bacterium]